jgi:hypothetical protein
MFAYDRNMRTAAAVITKTNTSAQAIGIIVSCSTVVMCGITVFAASQAGPRNFRATP